MSETRWGEVIWKPPARAARDVAAFAGTLVRSTGSRGGPRVSYGFPGFPWSAPLSFGGIVKVRHLQDAFPATAGRFNLLYLVSSRLPPGAIPMARAARFRGARLVLNQDGVAYPGWHGPGWQRVNRPMGRLLHAADFVFYQSEFSRFSADSFLGLRQGPSDILYNPVDTRLFSPADRSRRDGTLVLLAAGSIQRLYRLEAALATLSLLVKRNLDVMLRVAGRLVWAPDPGDCLREATRLAELLGVSDRVEFLGPYRQDVAPELFRSADALLHTKYNDPCPTVVLEAMASGLPVVYSASGGVPELVGPDAGVGVPAELSWDRDIPPDPLALADGVQRVHDCLPRFSDAARQRAVDRFDVVPWVAKHREVFEALMTASGT